MEQEVISKLYYSTQEVADILNITGATLRSWIRRFNLTCQKNSRGKLKLSQRDLRKIKYIHTLITVERYSLEGVDLKLKSYQENG